MNKLEDICLRITDGKHGDCKNEERSGYYFISCKDVNDGWIDYSSARQITQEDFLDTHRRTQLAHNDIVLTNSGTIGRMALVKNSPLTERTTFQKSVAIIKPNHEKVNPTWLYYSLSAKKKSIIALASGTAQKNLLLKDIRSYEVFVPTMTAQQRIASALSAYDNLIENNNRRIQILEEMAQTVYREWLVNFHFPGYEKVRMVKSELGLIPDRWEIGNYTDFIDVLSGGTPKTSIPEYWDGDISWFTPQDLSKQWFVLDTVRKITNLGLTKCASKLYPQYTVIITARGTVGKCVLASTPMAISQTNYALIGKNNTSQFFNYLLTLNQVDKLKQQATGAVFDTIIIDNFRKLRILYPQVKIINDFHNVIEPVFLLIKNLQEKSENLRQQRDLLLPKLVSGEIDLL